jgi:hypothetical protein
MFLINVSIGVGAFLGFIFAIYLVAWVVEKIGHHTWKTRQ